jgi:hypothetical protein
MTDDRVRTPRTLFIADHIWDAFARMATEMGSERDGLINQALFMFARLNGYLSPGEQTRAAAAAQAQGLPASAAAAVQKRMTAPLDSRAVTITPASAIPAPNAEAIAAVARPAANPERVAELERQLNVATPAAAAPAARAPQAPVPAKGSVEIDDSLLGDDMGGGAQATSMELPNLAELGIAPPRKNATIPPVSDRSVSAQRLLVLMADGRELDRVAKDRFLIGRGKHCDLIINSGKVSREHAAIIRENGDYFIEDLGSSNGTWYDKRRITRRQIEDGDEYYICAEKLSCVFR